jgi:MoaA/NifB/PqqE/SkfB family radical SAM enzyme
MSKEMIDKIVLKFPTITGYCICGFGEPLMSPNLDIVLQVLNYTKKFIGLITNGSLIHKHIDMLKRNAPNYISISLNAHNAEAHEKATGTKTWDRVISNIKMLIEQTDIDVFVSSVTHTENLKHVPELLKLVKGLGVKTVHLHNILPHYKKEFNDSFWNLVLQDKHAPLIEELKKLPEADIVDRWPVLIDRNGGKCTCQFPWRSIAVNGDGNISLCNSVMPCHSDNGNINNCVIWNSSKTEEFREDYLKGNIWQCKMCFRNWHWQ